MIPQAIIFMGPPGSGKGTQRELIQQRLHNQASNPITIINTGQELRNFFKVSDGFTHDITQEIQNSGNLQPDFLSNWVTVNVLIENMKYNSHLFLDGYPRSIGQTQTLDQIVDFYKFKIVSVIYFEVPFNVVKERMILRGREDDKSQTIGVRFDNYEKITKPILEYMKNNSRYKLYLVDANRPVEEIHQDVVRLLGYDD